MHGGGDHRLSQGEVRSLQVPQLVEFRSSLPKSAIGKDWRKILREEETAKKGNLSLEPLEPKALHRNGPVGKKTKQE